MFENPGDELYFGEVYRRVLQDAWLPAGAEEWMRVGKSRRGRRPTQRGLGAQSPTISQALVRRCFQLCVQNWNQLPLEYPAGHPCVDIPGKKWWWQQKEEKGLMCSYFDHYMRYCMFYCVRTSCPPEDIVCYAWDPDSTKETIHDYWAGIYVIGGFPPYEWQVNDPPFWLQALITSIPRNGITTREDVCGIGRIKVTDYCGRTVEGVVTTPDVPWPYLPPTWPVYNEQEIDQDEYQDVYIADGVPPFKWEVSGQGFSLAHNLTQDRHNTLYASPTACGSAKICVTDCLLSYILASLRCTAGQWVQKSEGVCGLSGSGILIAGGGTRTPEYALVSGYQKQWQSSYCPVNFGDCWGECNEIACGMGITLEEFCQQVRDTNCTFTPRCSNCVDSDHQFCICVGPPGHPHRTWCVGNLKYYEWEC